MNKNFRSASLLFAVLGASILVNSLATRQSVAFTSPIPNLVGTWKVETQGATLLRGTSFSNKSHHAGEFTTLTAEATIQKQEGRRVLGVFKSPRYTEKFAWVIGVDGKSLAGVDEDGLIDGKIVTPNRIEVFYRHVNANESVVATGTYARQK